MANQSTRIFNRTEIDACKPDCTPPPSYKGVSIVNFVGSWFYRNPIHLQVDSFHCGSILDQINVDCCELIESIGAAIVINAEVTNSRIRNSKFSRNWRRNFVLELSEGPRPLPTPIALTFILDGPFFSANFAKYEASEILFNVDPSGWTITDCLIALTPRSADVGTNVNAAVPSISIPSGVPQVNKDFISGILIDRSQVDLIAALGVVLQIALVMSPSNLTIAGQCAEEQVPILPRGAHDLKFMGPNPVNLDSRAGGSASAWWNPESGDPAPPAC